MKCDDLHAIMGDFHQCEETSYGTKISTHCLYPSFDPVSVYVIPKGDGFRVTDGRGAVRCAFSHTKDETSAAHGLKKASVQFMIESHDGLLATTVTDREWLMSAILAVANCSALAASIAVDHAHEKIEKVLKSRIFEALSKATPAQNIASDYHYNGASGKAWHVDYAVIGKHSLLVKAISPHHVSINSNYAAYSDIAALDGIERFSVYERKLENDDAALMRQVANIVPIDALEEGARRALNPLARH